MFGSSLSTAVNVIIRADARQATRSIGTVRRVWRGFTQATSRVRAGLLGLTTMMSATGAGFVAIGLGVRASLRQMYQYSDQAARLRAIIHSSGDDIREYPNLMAAADQASRRWGFGMSETAHAMGTIVETGIGATNALRMMGISAEFARVAEIDLGNAAQFLVDSHNQFNVPISQMRQLAATLNAGSRIAATSVEQLRQGFRYASVEMSSIGYTAIDTVAALGTFAAAGIKAMPSGTRLRQLMIKLASPTRAAIQMARSFGISAERMQTITHDASGRLRPFVDALRNWRDIQRDLTEHQRLQLSAQVVGTRALAGALIYGTDRGRRTYAAIEELSNQQEILARHTHAAEARMHGFAAQMNLAKRAGQELGITFAELLLGGEGDMTFGRTLTDFATAVRLSDETARNTDQARQAWAALSPEMQQRGTEWREVFQGLAEFLRILATDGLSVLKGIANNPRLTASLGGTYAIGSLLMPMFAALLPFLLRTNTALGGSASGAGAAGGAAAASSGGLTGAASRAGTALLGLAKAGAGIAILATIADLVWRYGDKGASALVGMSDEYNQVRERALQMMNDSSAGWISYIPLLGAVYEKIMNIRAAYQLAAEAEATLEQQRRTTALRETSPGERFTNETAAGRARGMSGNDASQRAAGRVFDENLMSIAALMQYQDNWITWLDESFGDVNREDARANFRQLMQQQGVYDTNTLDALDARFQQMSTTMGREGIRDESQRLRRAGVRVEDLVRGLNIGRRESGNYDRAYSPRIADVNSEVSGRRTAMESSGLFYGYVPELRMPANTNRDRAIEAIAANARASRAGETATPARPQPVEINAHLEIPVQIEGREIARAANTYNLESDGRRGSVDGGRRAQVQR